MLLDNCRYCGKLFLKSTSSCCADCRVQQNEYYVAMRQTLKQYPNMTVLELHNKTGIPVHKLLEMSKKDYVPYGR